MALEAEIKNMRLLSHDELGGYGNIGEGMALQQLPGGRRIMWLAHESYKDLTAVDVTDPSKPRMMLQTDLPHHQMRSNSLALVDNTLYVARQVTRHGVQPAGMDIYDVSSPESPRHIGTFDASGTHSRGTHCLWCVDGHYAHLTTGMPDARPRNLMDDQFYVIVNVSDPTSPREVGRWWVPGTMEEDTEPPPERHPQFDSGFSMHNVNVYPQRPQRAYCASKDGGVIILDISDIGHPYQISRLDYHPPLHGFTHTVLPLFNRELMIVSEESVMDGGGDWPKLVWVMDMRVEANPVMLCSLPLPEAQEFIRRPGRFGAHNLHENQPLPTSFVSEELVFGTYFNGGLRVHNVSNPFQPREVAYFIPAPTWDITAPSPEWQHQPMAGVNLNDVYVDEKGLVYTVDRQRGGLYILELTI